MPPTSFRDRLIEAQLESGVSARQIAIRAGIEPSHFSRLGSGEASSDAVRWEIVKALAGALGVEVMWLMEGREPKRPGDYVPPSVEEKPRDRFRRLAPELGFRPEVVDFLMTRYKSAAYDAPRYDVHWWYAKARNRELRDRALRHDVAAKHYARASQKAAEEQAAATEPTSQRGKRRRTVVNG